MAKPLGEFGGWLRVFLIITWLGLLSSLLGFAAAFSVALLSYGPFEDWDTHKRLVWGFLGILETGIAGYLYYLIIKIFKIRSPSVPDTIIRLMLLIFTLSLLFAAVEVPVSVWTSGEEWSDEMATDLRNEFVSAAGVLAFWYWYFKTSRRVKSYYREDGYVFRDSGLTET